MQHERRQSMINDYSPLKKYELKSPLSEAQLPSERINRVNNVQPVIDLPPVPSSARNIVSLDVLKQIKQLAV